MSTLNNTFRSPIISSLVAPFLLDVMSRDYHLSQGLGDNLHKNDSNMEDEIK